MFSGCQEKSSIIERLLEHGFNPPTEDLKEAEEIISDVINCLWSYKTALKIRATANDPSQGGPQTTTQLLLTATAAPPNDNYSLPDFDFEAPAVERSESDIFDLWSSWEANNRAGESATDLPKAQSSSVAGGEEVQQIYGIDQKLSTSYNRKAN